jgi:hypothetical protein
LKEEDMSKEKYTLVIEVDEGDEATIDRVLGTITKLQQFATTALGDIPGVRITYNTSYPGRGVPHTRNDWMVLLSHPSLDLSPKVKERVIELIEEASE